MISLVGFQNLPPTSSLPPFLKRLSKYDSAIIRLQSALRLNSSDHASWECLGDSYMKEGKFMAALKAFNRSIEVAAGSAISALLYPRCRIADIHYKLGQFEEAVEKYTIILDSSSFSSSGQMLIARKLADSQLYLARELIADGAFGRACDILGRALTLGVGCIHARINTERCAGTLVGVQGMMKVLGDSCAELRMVPGYLHLLDFSTFEKIQLVCQLLLGDKLEVYPTKKNGSLAAAAAPLLSTDYILYIGAAAYQAAISIFASGKLSHPATSKKILANYWHDLACVNYWRYRLYVKESPDGTDQSLLTSAAKYLKTALKQNPKNSLFWNSLGCITFFTGPALAQHSFIRSIEFDSKVKQYSHFDYYRSS